MHAIFINGSPRKNWNTHKLLIAAAEGAQEAGATTEIIHLDDLTFKGCTSCFACKLKGNKTNGICAMRDDLRPVLEKCMEADALVVGSPIYLGATAAAVRAFHERLLFPVLRYKWGDDGKIGRTLPKEKRTAMILTGNISEDMLEQYHYDIHFGDMAQTMGNLLGSCELMFVCDTYQFDDYSKYDIHIFDPVKKAEHRDKQFPVDLQKARELGKRLCG